MTSAVLVKELDVWVQEASASGCLIESALPLAIGTIGQIEVEFADGRRLEWFRICRVHAVRGNSRVRVFGAEFLPVAAAGGESLRGAIGRLVLAGSRESAADTGRSSGDARNSREVGSAAAGGKDAQSRGTVLRFEQRTPPIADGNGVADTDGEIAPGAR